MTDQDPQGPLEEWKSMVRGRRSICRWTEKGEIYYESVLYGGTFHITPEERRKNESRARDQRDNPFKNGTFAMVEAAPDDDDSQERSKSESYTDEELSDIINQSTAKFEVALGKVTEYVTVDRIYNIARKEEVGGKKMTLITKKLKELNPSMVAIGDEVGSGREDPNDTSRGPTPDVTGDVEEVAQRPREYAENI